jgi:hypothetical protein
MQKDDSSSSGNDSAKEQEERTPEIGLQQDEPAPEIGLEQDEPAPEIGFEQDDPALDPDVEQVEDVQDNNTSISVPCSSFTVRIICSICVLMLTYEPKNEEVTHTTLFQPSDGLQHPVDGLEQTMESQRLSQPPGGPTEPMNIGLLRNSLPLESFAPGTGV